MSQTLAVFLGSFLCFGVPTITLIAGFYVVRNGMPLVVRWRREGDDD